MICRFRFTRMVGEPRNGLHFPEWQLWMGFDKQPTGHHFDVVEKQRRYIHRPTEWSFTVSCYFLLGIAIVSSIYISLQTECIVALDQQLLAIRYVPKWTPTGIKRIRFESSAAQHRSAMLVVLVLHSEHVVVTS